MKIKKKITFAKNNSWENPSKNIIALKPKKKRALIRRESQAKLIGTPDYIAP